MKEMAMPYEDNGLVRFLTEKFTNGLVRFLIEKFTPHEKVSEREKQSRFVIIM